MTTSDDQPSGRPASLDDRQLAQINRLTTIARLVSGLAHELNNSLQVMGGLVELLADRADIPADAAVRIQKIGGQADKASGVIRQVLAFTRGQGGERASFELGAVVDRALALRRYQLGRAGIVVNWTRPVPEPFRVSGEERLVEQVVLNLLVNAEEALDGQPDRRITLALARVAGVVQLSVADTGPGVPGPLRARIFEAFFTTRTSDRAIGLGLTVSASIAAAHGGRLLLTDAAPGATFVLELPEKA